jgi:hypothetical protein
MSGRFPVLEYHGDALDGCTEKERQEKQVKQHGRAGRFGETVAVMKHVDFIPPVWFLVVRVMQKNLPVNHWMHQSISKPPNENNGRNETIQPPHNNDHWSVFHRLFDGIVCDIRVG